LLATCIAKKVILKTESEKIIFFLRFKKKNCHISTHGLSEAAKNIEKY
jgi:hypothetical protein